MTDAHGPEADDDPVVRAALQLLPVPEHDDGSNVEFLLTHPTGFVEMYAGVAQPAKVEVRTDGVMRSPFAKEYTAAHRMYGYVNGDLLYAYDMAAMGKALQPHTHAQLKRQ